MVLPRDARGDDAAGQGERVGVDQGGFLNCATGTTDFDCYHGCFAMNGFCDAGVCRQAI